MTLDMNTPTAASLNTQKPSNGNNDALTAKDYYFDSYAHFGNFFIQFFF